MSDLCGFQEITVRLAWWWLLGIYVLSLICVSGSAIQTKIQSDGACVSEHLIGGETGMFLVNISYVTGATQFPLIPLTG